jgi:HlyD family secretion protein
MSKMVFRDISEISDSREVLTERPQRFVSVFAYILIALLAIALIWSFVGELDNFVRAAGEVRPNESISTIRSTLSGRVLESHLEEGMVVSRGEILLSIDVQDHLNTMEILEKQRSTIDYEIANLELFRESIIVGENLFDPNDETQIDYYFRYQSFVTDIEFNIEQVRNTNLDIARVSSDAHALRNAALADRNRANSELQALRRLLGALENSENSVAPAHAEHNRRFADHEMSMERYANVIAQRESALVNMEEMITADLAQFEVAIERSNERLTSLELLYEIGGVSRNERDAAQFELDSIMLERDRFIEESKHEIDAVQQEISSIQLEQERFTNETKLLVLQEITALERYISDRDAAMQSAHSVLISVYDMGYSEELVRERHRLDMLTSISDTLFSLQSNLSALMMEISSLRLTIDESQITAPIDGVISMFSEINTGDFIQAGLDIATIIPATDGEFRVMLAVSNEDIAEIEVGQRINFRFAALPFADFGEMPGHITRISTDARSAPDGQSYFIVEAEMDGNSLFDRHGAEAQIRVGMMSDARVITGSQRIIHWVVERLGFAD